MSRAWRQTHLPVFFPGIACRYKSEIHGDEWAVGINTGEVKYFAYSPCGIFGVMVNIEVIRI